MASSASGGVASSGSARYAALPTTLPPPPTTTAAYAHASPRWLRAPGVGGAASWSLGARAAAAFAVVYVVFALASSAPGRRRAEPDDADPDYATPNARGGDGADAAAPRSALWDGAEPGKEPPRAKSTTTTTPSQWCSRPLRFLSARGANVTLLSSYPGSGNTWVRHLVELGTRAYTGSAYNDTSLAREFRGEGRWDASVVAVKTHYPCGGCWKVPPAYEEYVAEPMTGRRSYAASTASVLILRNPFDAILSEFNRVRSGFNHTGTVDSAALQTTEFVETVRRRALSWRRHTTFYLTRRVGPRSYRDENGNAVYVVFYESLREKAEAELEQLFEFLKTRRPRALAAMDARVAARCAVGDAVGQFKRPKPAQREDPFDRTFERFDIKRLTFQGQTNPSRPDETLRAMVCRVLRGLWREDAWGECDRASEPLPDPVQRRA